MTLVAAANDDVRITSQSFAQWLAVILAAAIGFSNTLTLLSSTVLALLCCLQMRREDWRMIIRQPATLAILFLVALSVIDATFSSANGHDISQALRKTARLLFFPLFLTLFTNIIWQYRAVTAFLLVFILSILTWYYSGVTFRDSIFSSLFAAFLVFTLAHYCFENRSNRLLLWLAIPIMLFLTHFLFFKGDGRVGQYLFVMFVVLFVWQRFVFNIKMYIGAFAILCAVIGGSFLASDHFVHRHNKAWQEIQQYMHEDEANIPYGSSLGTRLILAHNSWELVKLKPWLGWGTGSFREVYAEYAPEAQIKEDIQRTNPHNQYLLTWVELGLPGLVCLIFLFTSLAWFFFQYKNINGYLGFGLTCAMIIGCTMNSWLLDITSTFFFIFFAAMLYSSILTLKKY
jgi:O-antigen ligase